MKAISLYLLCCLLSGLLISSCTGMNDYHDEYLKRGETLYVGKVDSARIYPGLGRLVIQYWNSDPKAKKLKVYWKSRTDSMLLDIPEKPASQAVEIVIPNLEENNYLIEMVTMNAEMKNPSIVFQAGGRVYGDKFQASLSDRQIRTAVFMPTGEAEIRWLGAVEKAIGTELSYTDKTGKEVNKFVPIGEQITTLADLAGNLRYRTLFVPEAMAVDTFYRDFQAVSFGTIKELDKTKYAKWNPPGIPYMDAGTTFQINRLWDKNTGTWYVQSLANRLVPGQPHSFTFDLGQTVKLNRFKQWQRLGDGVVYEIQNLRKFEVWGSATPNVDARFDGWVKLGDFESIKPSGAPWQSNTEADKAFAAAGETFIVSSTAPAVRYIRYVVKETWSTGQSSTDKAVSIGEVSFFEIK